MCTGGAAGATIPQWEIIGSSTFGGRPTPWRSTSIAMRRDFGRFLRYALNSASELEYHLTLARDIQVLSNKTFTPLATEVVEVRKMLHGLLKSLSTQSRGTHTPRTAVQS